MNKSEKEIMGVILATLRDAENTRRGTDKSQCDISKILYSTDEKEATTVLSEYINNTKAYDDSLRAEGRKEGIEKKSKDLAFEMFTDGKDISEIKKYTKLPVNELSKILRELPKTVQKRYDLNALVKS
jgi:hypothetical protein